MRRAGARGGFQLMAPPSEQYYAELPSRIGDDVLSAAQLVEAQELGLLVDATRRECCSKSSPSLSVIGRRSFLRSFNG